MKIQNERRVWLAWIGWMMVCGSQNDPDQAFGAFDLILSFLDFLSSFQRPSQDRYNFKEL